MFLLRVLLLASVASFLAACTSMQFEPAADTNKFYADKLACENQYSQGFNIWGNKVYGDIYHAGAAQDCMLAKGYALKAQ